MLKNNRLYKKALCCSLILCLVISTFAGCSSSKYDKTMFSYGGNDIPMKSVWVFTLDNINMYSQYYGNTFWDEEMSTDDDGNKIDLKESIIRESVDNVREVYTVLNKASDYDVKLTESDETDISDSVSEFKLMFGDLLKNTDITDDDLKIVFTDYTKYNKICDQVLEKYKNDIDEDDYKRKAYYDYALCQSTFDANGEEVKLSKKELKAQEDQMSKVYSALESGKKISDLSSKYPTDDSATITIGNDNKNNFDKEIIKQIKSLNKVGDYTEVFETDGYWHILVLTDLNDTEASEDAIDSAVTNRYYEEFITDLEKEYGEFNFSEDVDKTCIDTLLDLFSSKMFSAESSDSEKNSSSEVATSSEINDTDAEEQETEDKTNE